MRNLIILLSFCSIFYSCNNAPAPIEKTTSGSDFMKQEKPKVDLTVIDPNASLSVVTLQGLGNTMAEMKYDKDTIKVPANCTVSLTLINTATDDAMQHNFLLVTNGSIKDVADEGLKAGPEKDYVPVMDEVLMASKLIKPGEKTTIKFAAPVKGVYEFMCSYPGHYTKMKGVFVVE